MKNKVIEVPLPNSKMTIDYREVNGGVSMDMCRGDTVVYHDFYTHVKGSEALKLFIESYIEELVEPLRHDIRYIDNDVISIVDGVLYIDPN